MNKPILNVKDLKKYFPQKEGVFSRIKGYTKAVDGIDLDIHKGETLGLVGESGCGKTTTGRCILRLTEPTSGSIHFMDRNILELCKEELREFRKNMQIVFQDPFSSFNPRMIAENIISEPLKVHNLLPPGEIKKRMEELMIEVGLDPAYSRRYPHEFSGGQRQRIGIARAIALNPSLIVADEPVSSLDVSVQAQVMNLLCDLKEKHDLTYLFISHDLSIVKFISDRIVVMYSGKIVETGNADAVFNSPRHPYTKSLLVAVPVPDPDIKKVHSPAIEVNNSGVEDFQEEPEGCNYYHKCSISSAECREFGRPLTEIPGAPGHLTCCIRFENI